MHTEQSPSERQPGALGLTPLARASFFSEAGSAEPDCDLAVTFAKKSQVRVWAWDCESQAGAIAAAPCPLGHTTVSQAVRTSLHEVAAVAQARPRVATPKHAPVEPFATSGALASTGRSSERRHRQRT